MPDHDRWNATWRQLGLEPPADKVYHDLIARYAEPHRAYHTIEHIDECLAAFDTARHLAERPAEVELVIWYHVMRSPGSGDSTGHSGGQVSPG